MLLKAKVALNHWDGKLQSIEEKWEGIFPNTTITIIDNQDMTMEVEITGDAENITSLLKDLIDNDMIVPRPQGVQLNNNWTTRVQKLLAFDYDMSNNDYGGLDVGAFAVE
jgi:hypothetical protein